MFNPDCMLMRGDKDLRTMHNGKVDCTDCERCGWNPDVELQRKEYARHCGLLSGKDGLLYIPARPEHER